MELRTERLLLREFEQSDVPVLHRYNQHPLFRRYEEGPVVSEYQFYQIVQDLIAEQRVKPRKNFYFAIDRLDDDLLIGSCYLAIRDEAARQAEIGYMLGVDFWRQGYATEAARSVIAFGFETLGLHRIYAEAVSENQASVSLLERLGMRREGLLRESRWFQNRWWDTSIYALLEQDWQKAQ